MIVKNQKGVAARLQASVLSGVVLREYDERGTRVVAWEMSFFY
jgi:hypothetical protein